MGLLWLFVTYAGVAAYEKWVPHTSDSAYRPRSYYMLYLLSMTKL